MCSDFYSENTTLSSSLLHGTDSLFLKDVFFQGGELFIATPEFLDQDLLQVGDREDF